MIKIKLRKNVFLVVEKKDNKVVFFIEKNFIEAKKTIREAISRKASYLLLDFIQQIELYNFLNN